MSLFPASLTQAVMEDPVVAADGESYERSAWEAWLAHHGAVSPLTGAALEHTAAVPNHALRSTIDLARRRAAQAASLG